MAKVKGKELLCSTKNFRTHYKSFQGLKGFTLFERYDAMENLVNNNIREEYRDFLAQPVVDDEHIYWYTKTSKETARQLFSLDDQERAKYEQIKNDTIAHYEEVTRSLRQAGKTDEAESLEGAIKYIDDRFVYCFDDKTVLGIWGMQLRNEVREPWGVAAKNEVVPKPKRTSEPGTNPDIPNDPDPGSEADPEPGSEPEPPADPFVVHFKSGEGGNLSGTTSYTKHEGEFVTEGEVPKAEAKQGYEFTGWDKNPVNHTVTGDTVFTAQYRKLPVPPPALPWYRRWWRWLWWLLLLLLLLLLLFWLLRRCNRDDHGVVIPPIHDTVYIRDPYTPQPTPPDYRDILPPEQGVLPPLDSTHIINDSGRVVLDNRLNILMENEDKSILDLARDFKLKYPDDKYKIVYYDDVVKRMQVEVPPEEKEQLKQEIPAKMAPPYTLFVFDEALFEDNYTPNDPAFSDAGKSWYLKTVKAPQAWDITKGSDKLTVAIVDNGFNLKHPELKSKVTKPYNVWLHSNSIFPQKNDHGTHVAGTALAAMDNNEGICGIAPLCAFMPVQVGNDKGMMTTTSVLDGILYALYQGADVINVSLGGQFTGLDHYPKEIQEELLRNHFKEEERLWNEIMRIANKRRSTLVVAAGNDNILAGIDPIQRPKNIVTVGAINQDNQSYNKAGFSNYGSYTTISAPGVNIYSSVGENSYAMMEGTSMAAPIVTGAIALMKSLNDTLTNQQIICILQSTGVETKGNVGKLVQVDKALEKVKSGKFDCKGPLSPSTGDVQVLLNWNNYNDLDLVCTDPQGHSISYKNKRAPCGGQLEIDMNVNANDSKTPLENIFWPEGGAPKGTYNVSLIYFRKHESRINETPYTIKVKYGTKTEMFQGTARREKEVIPICSFTLAP